MSIKNRKWALLAALVLMVSMVFAGTEPKEATTEESFYSIGEFFKLLGSLGLFLFGMKYMSEGIQKAASSKLRQILRAVTSNKFFGIVTGLFVTTLIQSSSATTVMVVSFTNAGLFSLVESVSVIMGANIGTTVTGWLIAIVGKFSVADLALPILGISFPFLFMGGEKIKNWAEFVIGFALLFFGLGELKDSVPDIKNNPEILSSYVSIYLYFCRAQESGQSNRLQRCPWQLQRWRQPWMPDSCLASRMRECMLRVPMHPWV